MRNRSGGVSTRRGCCRFCLQTLANRSRERRIYDEIFSWIYLEDRPPTTMAAKRENCVCRHSKPIQFADDSALLSGNYFRALGKRVSRLSPLPTPPILLYPCPSAAKRIRAHSRSIATDTRMCVCVKMYVCICTYTSARARHDDVRDRPFEDEIDRRCWLVLCQK